MERKEVDKKDDFNKISQEIKEIPIIKEYIEKYYNGDNRRYPEDLLMCVALGMDFWDLDTPSQNKLIKEMIVRILKLESEI